jgi:hypothetical protein
MLQRQKHYMLLAMGVQQHIRLDDQLSQVRHAMRGRQSHCPRSESPALHRLRLNEASGPAGFGVPTQVLACLRQLIQEPLVSLVRTGWILLQKKFMHGMDIPDE